MKKLLTLFAFAVGGILCVNAADISGTDFEQFTLDENNTPATVIATDDSGKLSNVEGYAGTFWGPADYAGVANVVAKMSEDGTKVENKYLFVNTSGETLIRNISTDGSAQDLTTITDGKLFFDSKVQFTATESLSQQAVIGGTDKLIVWLKEETKDDITTTNLVVTAAQITSTYGGEVKDYVITNLEGFVPGQWYQLTIVAYPNAFSMANVPAFAVYVDGVRAEYDLAESAIATDAGVTVDDSCLWLGNGIFPSLQLNKTDNRQQITSVAFEGYGYVDNLEFSTDLPSFALPPAGLTIKWGEGIASITVNDGTKDVVITPGEGDYATVNTWKFGAGNYTFTTILKPGYFNNSLPANVDATTENKVCNFAAEEILFQINGTSYASITSALEAAKDGDTVSLYRTMNEQVTINKNIILDLKGNDIISESTAIYATSSMTIIDSVGGGEIVNKSENDLSQAILADGTGVIVTIGMVEGDKGVKVKGYAYYAENGGKISFVRAYIQYMDVDGFQKPEAGEMTIIANGSSVSAEAVDGYWVVAPKSTEEPTTYTVTFNYNYEGAKNKEVEVEASTAITEPDPTREHYEFAGWTLNGEKYDPATAVVTGPITLVAQWTLNQYTVIFDYNYDGAEDKEVRVAALTAITEPDPTREHYTFVGWTLNGEAYDPATAVVTGPITLEAQWTLKQYTVTFDYGYEGDEDTPELVNALATVDKPADPTRDGYTFAGWFLGNDAYNFETPVTSNITLVAQWKAPEIGGNAVAPEEVFNTANSETGIVYPSVPQVSPPENGPQTITFNGTTVNVPEYYTATLNDKTVTLTLNEKATPVIGATEANGDQEAIPAFAMEVKGENGEVVPNTIGIGVPNTNPKLYYGISVSTSLTGFVPDSTTLQKGGKALQLKITKGEGNVKFFKVYVTDIAPKTTPAQ